MTSREEYPQPLPDLPALPGPSSTASGHTAVEIGDAVVFDRDAPLGVPQAGPAVKSPTLGSNIITKSN